jgi:outer membrane protein OmpA-like peptidoglycan-associated protein
VAHAFTPYQSLDKEFVNRRLLRMINAPANVQLAVSGDQLVISGYASRPWIEALKLRIPLIQGLGEIDLGALRDEIDLSVLALPKSVQATVNIDEGKLTLQGQASEAWQQNARAQAMEIPGVRIYDDGGLKVQPDLSVFEPPEGVQIEWVGSGLRVSGIADSAWIRRFNQRLEAYPAIVGSVDLSDLKNSDELLLRESIEQLRQLQVFFPQAESLIFDGRVEMDAALPLVRDIIKSAKNLQREVQIVVQGYTDSLGSFQDNVLLSLDRASFVAQHLFNNGINPRYVEIRGIDRPVPREASPAERPFNRRVNFDVNIKMSGDKP